MVISSSPPGFPSAVLGLGSVLGVATAPMVPAVAPPLFRPFVSASRFPHAAVPAAPSSLPLRFSACCSYGCSFQSSPRFPHAAALAVPSSLHPRFPHAAALAASIAFGAAPAVFLAEGSPDAVPWGLVASLPCVYARFLSMGFRWLDAFVYDRFVSSGCGHSLGVSSSSCLFEVFFAPASVPPQPVCLALFCVTVLVSMVLLPRSDLRFPSRHGLPLGRVRVAATSVYLGSQGYFMWWYPFSVGFRPVPLTHLHLRFA